MEACLSCRLRESLGLFIDATFHSGKIDAQVVTGSIAEFKYSRRSPGNTFLYSTPSLNHHLLDQAKYWQYARVAIYVEGINYI